MGRLVSGMRRELKLLKRDYEEDDLGTVAASLAYRFFLALFPFFIFLAALSGFATRLLGIQDPTEQVLNAVGGALPPSAADIISGQVGQVATSQNPGLLSVGIIGAIWAASSGVQAIMKAMSTAYDVPENRPWWKKYGVAVGLTVLSGLFIVGAVALMFAGQLFAREIVESLGFQGGWTGTVMSLLHWPVVIALLMLGIAFLYWACPNIDLSFKLVSPGAVLFVVVWAITSVLFAFYVANFGSYNATYGALGGVVVLLIWIYISSLLLLLGAEINARMDERAHPELMAERRRQRWQAPQPT